jgi:hypothetical protein
MFQYTRLLLSLALPILLTQAYKIDDTCAGADVQAVQQAAEEALNMFSYANFRITQNNPALDFSSDTVFDQLLGPNAKPELLSKFFPHSQQFW